jgi:hypothetical protein
MGRKKEALKPAPATFHELLEFESAVAIKKESDILYKAYRLRFDPEGVFIEQLQDSPDLQAIALSVARTELQNQCLRASS